MIAIKKWRISVTGLLAGTILLTNASTTLAAFVFTGQSVDVTFQEPATVFPDETVSIIAGTGPEIVYLDGSGIGDNIMIDFESIDFADTSVTFNLRGDADNGQQNHIAVFSLLNT